jgi:hypothetical protein
MLRNSSYPWMPRNRKKPGNPSYLEGEGGNGPSDGFFGSHGFLGLIDFL